MNYFNEARKNQSKHRPKILKSKTKNCRQLAKPGKHGQYKLSDLCIAPERAFKGFIPSRRCI